MRSKVSGDSGGLLRLADRVVASQIIRARDTFTARKMVALITGRQFGATSYLHAQSNRGKGHAWELAQPFLLSPCEPEGGSFWQPRHYDFDVWTEAKRIEKLRYIHRNPVRRGLVSSPEQWAWSSFRHYVSGVEGVVEIESQWPARKREQLGVTPRVVRQDQSPRPFSAKSAETRTGQPR